MRELHHPKIEEIKLENVLHALSDPTRLDLVRQLASVKELGVKDCGVSVAKSTLSHHFSTLREAGVTATRIEGTQRFVSLRKNDLNKRFPGLLTAILRSE